MTTMVWTYAAYLSLCVGITVWVARTLRSNGTVYVTEGRSVNANLIDSLCHLLIVGFYLVNLGFISLALRYGSRAIDMQSAIELLSTKVGCVLLGLGLMHFITLWVFAGMRKNNDIDRGSSPIFHDSPSVAG